LAPWRPRLLVVVMIMMLTMGEGAAGIPFELALLRASFTNSWPPCKHPRDLNVSPLFNL